LGNDHGKTGQIHSRENDLRCLAAGLNLIWRQGQEITDERGTRIRELLSLQVVVEDPYQEMIPAQYSWNEERLEEYARQLLSGNNPGFEYTYGERLRAWSLSGMPALDQIEQVILRVKASANTRRPRQLPGSRPWIRPKTRFPA